MVHQQESYLIREALGLSLCTTWEHHDGTRKSSWVMERCCLDVSSFSSLSLSLHLPSLLSLFKIKNEILSPEFLLCSGKMYAQGLGFTPQPKNYKHVKFIKKLYINPLSFQDGHRFQE